jgi:hypothetical protein
MEILTIKAYHFDELSNDAKENARNWFRENYPDYGWWDCVYDCFKEKAFNAGFDVDKIYFSGFWSQGDGAMFEYSSIHNALRIEFIKNLKLSPMREGWLLNNTCVSGSAKQSGRYYHNKSASHSIYWEVDNGDLHWSKNFHKWIENYADAFEDYVVDKYDELCHELYSSLKKEYEYLVSDENIDETIRINEYLFTENGKRNTTL